MNSCLFCISYRVHIYKFRHRWETHEPRGKYMEVGGNFHYKGIIQMCGWNGVYFSGLQVYEWVSFSLQSISMGHLFHPKSIWMGTIFAIESIWMGMFLTSPSIWMGWGPGTPPARPYRKSWQVTPPPSVSACILQYKIG